MLRSCTYAVPEAMRALHALSKSAKGGGLPETTAYIVHLRASQINGCSWCAEAHSRELQEAGEPGERIWTVAAWRESPYFTDAERAALELTAALTRLADTGDAVPDELCENVTEHYDEQAISSLLIEIASINVWNRFNVALHIPAGYTGWYAPPGRHMPPGLPPCIALWSDSREGEIAWTASASSGP